MTFFLGIRRFSIGNSQRFDPACARHAHGCRPSDSLPQSRITGGLLSFVRPPQQGRHAFPNIQRQSFGGLLRTEPCLHLRPDALQLAFIKGCRLCSPTSKFKGGHPQMIERRRSVYLQCRNVISACHMERFYHSTHGFVASIVSVACLSFRSISSISTWLG